MTYDSIKDMKTVGIIRRTRRRAFSKRFPWRRGEADPSTNPTSTVLYKSIISLKAGNAIVISPHPNAKKSILRTVEIVKDAARRAGAPENLVQCITIPSMEGTSARC